MNLNIKTPIISIIKAFPYALLISIIMNIGSTIQPIFIKLFTSEEVKLYDTLHEGKIAIYQTNFIQYFIEYPWSWFLIPSLAIIYFAFKATSLKKILIYLTIFIFATLMITDYLFVFIHAKNLDNHLSNLISNIIGSPIIAIIVILSLDTGYAINQYFEINHEIYRELLNGLIAIIYGFIIAFIVYIIYINVYTVTKSKIDLSIKAPIKGAYTIDNEANKTSEKNYGFLSSTSTNIEKIYWHGFSDNFTLNWEKKINKNPLVYNAEIRILDSCFKDKDKIAKAISASPTYVIKNINKFKLTANNGPLEMYTLPNLSNSSEKFLISSKDDKKKVIFWISESKTKGYDLTRFIDNSDQIKYSLYDNKISYVLTLVTFNDHLQNSQEIVKPRELSLQTNNEDFSISLIPPTQLNSKNNSQKNCQIFHKSENNAYNLQSITSKIILTIQEAQDIQKPLSLNSILANHNIQEEVSIEGFNGWIKAQEVEKNKLSSYINDLPLNSISVTAPIQTLYIDGKEFKQTLSSNNIQISNASLIGNATSDGFLKFTGNTQAVYINEERANLSRWEKLDSEYKYIAFFSLLGSIILIIFKRLKYILNANKQYTL
ncbi:hypothetical protein [Sulfurospirillum cavolei]|uniref:hypothetical protein n=1 Tax=Sulfurospirillum cavolei TaxID=366522 RepID=UPI000764A799|nr:hypothetical protein [Sulfurospirillum cavolei]